MRQIWVIIVFVVSEICIIPLTGLIISPCRVSPAPGSLGREQGGREEGESREGAACREIIDISLHKRTESFHSFRLVSTHFKVFRLISTCLDLVWLVFTCFDLFQLMSMFFILFQLVITCFNLFWPIFTIFLKTSFDSFQLFVGLFGLINRSLGWLSL